MKLVYIDITTMLGTQREFGYYDPENRIIYVLNANPISLNFISNNPNWQLVPEKWIKTYQKWYDIKDDYTNKNKPKNLIFALNLFDLINNKEMVVKRGKENYINWKNSELVS